jgi:hypothetical protein
VEIVALFTFCAYGINIYANYIKNHKKSKNMVYFCFPLRLCNSALELLVLSNDSYETTFDRNLRFPRRCELLHRVIFRLHMDNSEENSASVLSAEVFTNV